MAQNNNSQDYTNNADGYTLGGGTTERKLTITGADMTLTGSGTNVYTFPSATSTLYGTATGSITSSQLATSLTDETGSGGNVFATSPTLVTPILGAATATSINNLTITSSTGTLTIPAAVTLTGPASSGTAMTLGNAETVTGVKTFGAAGNVGKLVIAGTTSGSTILNATAIASGTLTLPAATDTLVGKATTDVFTNKDLTSTTNTFPNGSLVQVVNATFATVASGTTVIPFDNTIPQSTEGDQYMTLAITPKSTTNTLIIQVVGMFSNNATNDMSIALFQDATANALMAIDQTISAGFVNLMTLTYPMVAGTTSATTFKIRAGGSAAGTTTFNGVGGTTQRFSTIPKSSIIIWEYKS